MNNNDKTYQKKRYGNNKANNFKSTSCKTKAKQKPPKFSEEQKVKSQTEFKNLFECFKKN